MAQTVRAHEALLTLAAEYEARVLIAINGAQPGDPLEDCPSLPPQRDESAQTPILIGRQMQGLSEWTYNAGVTSNKHVL
jgi:hypothetical protein